MYNWDNLSVGILGAGIENISLTKYLLSKGAKVIIYDQVDVNFMSERLSELNGDNLMLVAGKDYTKKLSKHDIYFRSPGMLLDYAKKITNEKGKLSSAMQLFFELCPAKIIGVTGTKGKGTTAGFITEIMKNYLSKIKKGNVYLLGNIGNPQFDVINQLTADDWVVMEMSSFQLEDMTLSPHIAVVLNITPDHLASSNLINPNYHKTFEEYINAKKNILNFQSSQDFAVLGIEDELIKRLTEGLPQMKYFINRDEENSCYIKDCFFEIKNQGIAKRLFSVSKVKLVGEHNKINAQAAIMAGYLAGAQISEIQKGIESFNGLPHRLQLVGEFNKVKYFDDSYATDPDAAIAALKAIDEPIVLICGGASKGADFSEFAKTVKDSGVKAAVVVGDETENILNCFKQAGVDIPITKGLKSMHEIVSAARECATEGDSVLLSPACASFGLFKSAGDRGDQFIKEVMAASS